MVWRWFTMVQSKKSPEKKQIQECIPNGKGSMASNSPLVLVNHDPLQTASKIVGG